MLKMGQMGHSYAPNVLNGLFWGPKINTFEIFSKSVQEVFLKLYLMTGMENNNCFDFSRKIHVLKMGQMG